MKIGQVCPYDLSRPGGVRSHILGLSAALRQRGHTVEIIGPCPPQLLEGCSSHQCGQGYAWHFSGTQIEFNWAGWQELLTILKLRFDLLHFHTIWNPLMSLQLATFFRGPKVATFHDVAGPDTPGWARRLMPWASRAIQTLLVPNLIAVSAAAAEHLRVGRFRLIPNGLHCPPSSTREERQDFLLFLGRLEPRKGLEVLLRALALLGPRAPELRVAGDGYLRPRLEALAQELGVRARFLGAVEEDHKWQLLHQAQLLVVPSLGGESFGIVLLEAMACGTPPLAADNAGYAAVLQEQGEHLLARAADPVDLAEKLRRLLDSPQRREQLANWGLQEWQRYRWENLAVEVEAVYQQARSAHP